MGNKYGMGKHSEHHGPLYLHVSNLVCEKHTRYHVQETWHGKEYETSWARYMVSESIQDIVGKKHSRSNLNLYLAFARYISKCIQDDMA